MQHLINYLAAGRHTMCLVGGGGKTTIMYELGQALTALGRKVLLLTSTHIYQPVATVYAGNVAEAERLWQHKSYAVIGTPEVATGKLVAPPAALYDALSKKADVVLCEADGAKNYPCKVPAAHEPVLLADCDIVVAVCGMDALNKPVEAVCFRALLAAKILGVSGKTLLTAESLARLLTDARGARKNVGSRNYYIVLNKCDLVTRKQAEYLRSLLVQAGVERRYILLCGKDKMKRYIDD